MNKEEKKAYQKAYYESNKDKIIAKSKKRSKVKSSRKSSKKPLLSHDGLTKTEREILSMVTTEFLTIKQVATRRKCSKQAVYQHIDNLKKKGHLKQCFTTLEKTQPTLPKNNQLRLHGQEFNIKILYKDKRYKDILNRSNLINIDGNTIRLYNNSIEIYSGQSFFGEDTNQVTAKSFNYFNKLFVRLENDLKIIIIKPRYQNIKIVNSHYAEINNELAQECKKEGNKIRVYTTEEGKLWFLIDNSFNMHEAETVHPETSKPDMERVKNTFNDIRDNDHIPLSKLSQYMADTTYQINEISHGLKSVIDYIKSRIPKEEDKPKDDGIIPEYIG